MRDRLQIWKGDISNTSVPTLEVLLDIRDLLVEIKNGLVDVENEVADLKNASGIGHGIGVD